MYMSSPYLRQIHQCVSISLMKESLNFALNFSSYEWVLSRKVKITPKSHL